GEEVRERAEETRRDAEHLAVDLTQDEVHRAEDRDRVGDETALQEPRRDLEVVERRAAHLRAEGVRALSVADHVDADLTLRALDRVIRLAFRTLPHVAEPRAHRTAREVRDALAHDRDRELHLADAHPVAR